MKGQAEQSLVMIEAHRGWHQPRHLPHFDRERMIQMITYRLADALPRTVSRRQVIVGPEAGEHANRERIEQALDAGHGSCCLGRPEIAQTVLAAWKAFDEVRYHLLAWVVMPTHVHVLVTLKPGFPLAGIVQSWKSWTGRRIRTQLSAVSAWPIGLPIWQRDYWDRFVRDEHHFAAAVAYIHQNPVKAGWCAAPGDWSWSSAARGSAPGQSRAPRSDL